MKQHSLLRSFVSRSSLVAAVAVVALASSSASAAVVFSDTFAGGSTLNPASYPTPTSTSTGYTVASTKSSTNSLSSGDLKLSMGATTSGFIETQARFPAVTLASSGDFIGLTTTFTATNNLLTGGGTGSFIYHGLFNSANSNPATGLASSGLNTTAGSSFATGNAANWQGYVGRFAQSTVNNLVYTRPVQNGAGTTSANQDLLGNGSGGGNYNNPTGVQVGGGTTSALAPLTNGSVYTSDLLITLNGDGTASILSSLYAGNTATGTPLATQTVTAPATLLATTYDGMALGYRLSVISGGTSLASQIDYNAITVRTNDTPEPAALAVVGLAGAFGLRRRRA